MCLSTVIASRFSVSSINTIVPVVQASWNVMAHAQKPDFFLRRNRRVHLNRRGRQFSRLLATEVCASTVVMLDTPCSEVVWRVLATHSIRQFHLHFPSRSSPFAITFQLESTSGNVVIWIQEAPLSNLPRHSEYFVKTFLKTKHSQENGRKYLLPTSLSFKVSFHANDWH